MAGFVWNVAVDGYKWEEDRKLGFTFRGRGLVPITWEFREYHPLKECTGLFRDFASTPLTPEAIQAFANNYGHLGEGGGLYASHSIKGPLDFASDERRDEFERNVEGQRDKYNAQQDQLKVPQTLDEWKKAILDLQKGIAIWHRFRTNPGPTETKKLEQIIDQHLTERRIMARFEIASGHKPVLNLMPSTLYGAMWLQLAQAVDGQRDYRSCRTCHKSFELSPKFARKSKHYCSDACRSAAYRSRKEQARQLRARGKTIRYIAKELESDIETVKNWVAQGKG